eukprot:11392378-Alexandrium_andersonii.AAC.1
MPPETLLWVEQVSTQAKCVHTSSRPCLKNTPQPPLPFSPTPEKRHSHHKAITEPAQRTEKDRCHPSVGMHAGRCGVAHLHLSLIHI